MRSWWGEGVGSCIASPEVAVDIRPSSFPAASVSAAGVLCVVPRPGNRLVDTVPLNYLLLRCRGPCHVLCVENGGCWVVGRLLVAGTVPIAGGWVALPVTAALEPLGAPANAARGPLGVHSFSCFGAATYFICLHLRVLRLLRLYFVSRGSAFPHGRHLELQ